MSVFRALLERATAPDTDTRDLTADVAAAVTEASVQQGQAVVFTPGSTAAITTIEPCRAPALQFFTANSARRRIPAPAPRVCSRVRTGQQASKWRTP